jgi:creatinine amidohydrolase/Fe(II)-dependent formamide hydrolase-like protein
MTGNVFMAELSWPEFKKRVDAGATVFLPLGSTEQHGPHMSLNVDVVLPTGVCERVAREIAGLSRLPSLMVISRSLAPAAVKLFPVRSASTPIRLLLWYAM